MTIIPHKLQANRYASVVRIITNYDLSETDKLWRDASNIVYNNRPRSMCDGTFRLANGRP
ncbi:hypothetical protein GQ600_17212 [Phytophthora cactorum]|nr:hypothetical protein GQ600_17212 [Phytophthora cactorum]